MSKKTIIIGTLSSLLVVGGVATAAGILVNAASKTEGISLDQGVNFTVEDINGLLESFQNEINRNKYTSSQFTNKIKDIVTSNLKLEGKNASSLIDSATYSLANKEIVITLKSEYKYTLPQSYSNISLSSSNEDGNLNIMTISSLNLEFYTTYTFSRLNEIYIAFNKIISDSKYTQSEFENYFNENVELVKDLVVKNLWTSSTQNINPELIEDISLFNNQVQITFQTGYFSYNLGANLTNITLVNNVMTVRNFNFYKSIVIEVSKLNSLKSNIQNYIDLQDNQFTKEEFESQVNSLSFKNEVANQLGILSTDINKISYVNNILTITPNDMQKFDASVTNNNFIVDNNIQVENFNFYESQTLTQTENLFLELNEYIANAKYTSEEFGDKVNSKDKELEKIIQDNLLISTQDESEQDKEDPDKETINPINPDQILNYGFENNQLTIQLDTDFLKYNLVPTNNVSIDNGIITIKNFTFYTSVVIEDAKLNSFKSSVQNLIDTNKYTQSDFEFQLSSLDFKKSIATSLGIIASNINTITFANNTLEITPLQNQKFVSSIPTNNNSNLVNDNIQVSNFTFFNSFTITDTNNLFNLLQNYVSSNSDTMDEFKTKVNSNDATITSLINDNLLVIDGDSTKPIENNYITNFEFANNQLEIDLNTNYLKYSLSTSNNSANVSIQDGKVIVNNFTFFTAISVENDKLNEFKDNVQTLIEQQQYTLNDFQNQLSNLVFKNAIANYLGIRSENIQSITYENDILKIIPQQNQKFVTNSLNNNAIVDNAIQIIVTKFYESYTLTNLNDIYDKLNKYIGTNKLSQELFAQRVNDGVENIQKIIQNNIFVANGDNSYPIDSNNILGFKFVNNQLEITLKSDYTKFVTTSTNDNVELNGDKLIVKNFSYYQIIQINVDNLNNLKQNIQSLINTNQWTSSDLNNQLTLDTFKSSIAGYLGISSSYIDTMTFNDGTLKISSEVNKKFESTSPTSIINANDDIELSSFQFYTLETLSNFDALYKAINKFIADNKLTVDDFASQVSTNNNAIRELIVNNLQVNGSAIESSWINSITFVNDDTTKQLEVALNNYFVKYNATSTNTVQIENNKLIIKNLEYFNLITINNTNLNGLKNSIQQFIRNSSEQFTSDEFLAQINSNKFKEKIAEFLNIDVNAIGNIEFTNNILSISPNSMYKFKSSSDNNLIDDNGIIHLSNFTFFNLYDIFNLNALYNAIDNYIATSTDKFTEAQFAANVVNYPSSIKQVITNNLQLQLGDNTQNVVVDNITNVVYQNNQLEITLSDNYFKYQQITANNNISLNNNKVIVRNLHFYNEISFNSSNLTNLRTNIINLIDENKVNSNNISNYLSNQIYDLVKNINTVNNGRLEQYITTPTYSSNSIRIPLKSNIGLLKFASSSLSNISITATQISLNSISLYTPPTPSPVNWFTWDGTKITGLTDLGRQQTSIILPPIATSISNNAFIRNNIIKSVDMSLSKIVELPDSNDAVSSYETESTFSYCRSLETVILPPSLVKIGRFSFRTCEKLKDLDFPSTLETIGIYSFYECFSLKNIILPNSVKTIGRYCFYTCRSLTDVILPSNIRILNDALFLGCNLLKNIVIPNSVSEISSGVFRSCNSINSINLPENLISIGNYAFMGTALTSIDFPNNLKTIGQFTFRDCNRLESITLPNSITSIGVNCFSYYSNGSYLPLPNLIIYVNSINVENLVKGSGFSGTLINFSRP